MHPSHHTPQAAIIFQSLLGLALAISGTFEMLAILANVSALALYLGCALASWRLRQMGIQGGPSTPLRASAGAFRILLAGVVPLLATAVIVWLLTGLTFDEWNGFGVCLVAASVAYVVTGRRRA